MASINTIRVGTTNYAIVPSISQTSQTSASAVVSSVAATSSGITVYYTSKELTLNSINAAYITATSDARLKENIVNADLSDLCNSFDDIQLHYFNFKDDKTKQTNVGVIAQELQEILPEKIADSIVIKKDDGYYSVAESKLVYLCIAKIKQLEEEINKLKNK